MRFSLWALCVDDNLFIIHNLEKGDEKLQFPCYHFDNRLNKETADRMSQAKLYLSHKLTKAIDLFLLEWCIPRHSGIILNKKVKRLQSMLTGN